MSATAPSMSQQTVSLIALVERIAALTSVTHELAIRVGAMEDRFTQADKHQVAILTELQHASVRNMLLATLAGGIAGALSSLLVVIVSNWALAHVIPVH